MMDNKTLGYIFHELRNQRDIPLRKFSEIIGIDYSYLSKIENGAVSVQQHHLNMLLRYFGVEEESVMQECDTFFDELLQVLHINIQYHPDRVAIRRKFLEKYQYLYFSKYLPYLQFIELEDLGYSVTKDERFDYLLNNLDGELLAQPYRFFFLLRKVYHYCDTKDIEKLVENINLAVEMIKEVDEQYQAYGYYYILTGYAVLGDYSKIAQYYDLAHKSLYRIGNMHFAMLADIMYGGSLVVNRKYKRAIRFYDQLLENKRYKFSKYSKKSILFNMGEAYLQLGDLYGALKSYRKSYGLLPQKSTAFYMMYCYHWMNEIDLCIEVADNSNLIESNDELYEQLISWMRRYIQRKEKRDESYIEQLELIEEKFEATIDYCLALVLLQIKIDFYHSTKRLDQELIYLRKMVETLEEKENTLPSTI